MKTISAPSGFYAGNPLKATPALPVAPSAPLPRASTAQVVAVVETRLDGIPSAPVPAPATVTPVVKHLPWWKRATDLAICILALPVLGLFTLAMSIITSLVSPGPVFFRQVRIGHHGRKFRIYKFRTMRVGADNVVHQNYCKDLISTNAPMVKLDSRGDARLLPGAWLLRASGLDELPQLINVFLGEMSLVGPRPCLPAEFELYSPVQRERCVVLPGLTGLWQVSGKNRTTFDEMINLDVRYARQVSLGLDLKIIFLTAPSLFSQVLDTRRARKAGATPPSNTVVPFKRSTDSRAP
jgi:lipopolysaccharide/colanic/teichoic acid biosynthesis glycosyltransferase